MKIIDWTTNLSEKFEQLKTLMLLAPVVRLTDVEKEFVLETDGSKVAVGAVQTQQFDDTGLEHPIEFFDRALSGSKRNYAAYELEMYAVVRAVDHFQMFRLEREFLLRTGHMALVKLLQQDLPPTSRVERWILQLSEYTFCIQHQQGIDIVMANVRSRLLLARSSVVETDSISHVRRSEQKTRNINENGCTVSSAEAIQSGPSSFSCKNPSPKLQSVQRPTLGDWVATALTGFSRAGSGNRF